MNVRIVRRPIGEAPEWVRDAWIGISLPLAFAQPRRWPTIGVLSGPHGGLAQLWAMLRGRAPKVSGYVVNANVAVDRLAASRPDAADWWCQHAPHLLALRRCFMFDADACQPES